MLTGVQKQFVHLAPLRTLFYLGDWEIGAADNGAVLRTEAVEIHRLSKSSW